MRRAQGRTSWVALVAAYLLFFQAVIGGFAIGASAAPLSFDPLSALCQVDTGSPAAPDRPDQPAGHAHLPDCCTAGCSMFGGHLVPTFVAVLLVPQLAAAPEPAPRPAAPVAAAPQWSPANPRAPPAQA
jgi:hypothetical protein